MSRKVNIILIAILIGVAVWSLYTHNFYILITNICVISAVLIDEYIGKMLMKENVNIKLIKNIKKIVPVLYIIGAASLIIWGYSHYLN
jgi:general stress protein CsbA